MPVINVNVWKGISQEKIEYIIKNITKVFVDMGIPAHAVSVTTKFQKNTGKKAEKPVQ